MDPVLRSSQIPAIRLSVAIGFPLTDPWATPTHVVKHLLDQPLGISTRRASNLQPQTQAKPLVKDQSDFLLPAWGRGVPLRV